MNVIAFRRKMIYIVLMVVLLIPLYILGQPESTSKSGQVSGGVLAQIRSRHNISQSNLGEIDPASESMRLATLGLRGFAAAALWHKAQYYKTEFYWDRYKATLDQIALLQPHSVNVWDHQAHNLTYNIAVEFDGYKERYEWVKKGIDFLIKGTKYNARQPILQWTLGIYTGQKIGISDEKRQYRLLFRNDDKYHKQLIDEGLDVLQGEALGVENRPDHWLVGRLWFEKSYDLVKAGCYCKKTPHIYYSDGPKCQLRYSEAIEEEGVLDDRAKFSWSRSEQLWREFGQRDILTTWGDVIQLNNLQPAVEASTKAQQEFDGITKGIREQIRQERLKQLPADMLEALNTGIGQRTSEQLRMATQAEEEINPSEMAVALASPREVRDQAIEIARRLTEAQATAEHIQKYREQVNYDYWAMRAKSEQHPITLDARRSMYKAEQLLKEAKLDESLAEFDDAWVSWDRVLRRFPRLAFDDLSNDIVTAVKRYKRILDGELPDSFPLAELLHFKEQNPLKGLDAQSTQWGSELEEQAASMEEMPEEQEMKRYEAWFNYRRKVGTMKAAPAGSPSASKPSEESKPADSVPLQPMPSEPKAGDGQGTSAQSGSPQSTPAAAEPSAAPASQAPAAEAGTGDPVPAAPDAPARPPQLDVPKG